MGVEWAGWRTDTVALQMNGWELAVDFDVRYLAYRLLLRHKMMRLYAVSSCETIDNMSDPSINVDASKLPVFRIVGVAPSIQTLSVPGIHLSAFREVDALPTMVNTRITRVEDLNIFAAPMPGAKGEVLIDGADMSVIEHLEAIKRLQSATQAEIRERILDQRREGTEIDHSILPNAKSKVVALVNYKAA
jgi:hypothetical protein